MIEIFLTRNAQADCTMISVVTAPKESRNALIKIIRFFRVFAAVVTDLSKLER